MLPTREVYQMMFNQYRENLSRYVDEIPGGYVVLTACGSWATEELFASKKELHNRYTPGELYAGNPSIQKKVPSRLEYKIVRGLRKLYDRFR